MKLFGPSDHQGVTIPHVDGTVHKFDLKKNRQASPGYSNETRSLPVVNTDCVDCISHLKKAGFNTNPDMVTKTADEAEYEERAKGEGNLMSKLLAESFGRTLAQEAAKNINGK